MITLDSSSNVDTHVQIFKQIRKAIVLGIYRAGDRLPTVQAVCEGLGISPRTVQAAYTELARAGLAEGQRSLGTVVCEPPQEAVLEVAREMLRPAMREIRSLGITAQEARNLVEESWQQWFVRRTGDRRSAERAMPVQHDRRDGHERRNRGK